MIRLNIHEARTHLSRYLARVEAGETILLCHRNEPVAEIPRIRPAGRHGPKRVFGRDEGKSELGDDFFEPLPDSVVKAKTHLSHLIERSEQGEEITIMRANVPVAKLTPASPASHLKTKRELGWARSEFTVSEDFGDPLPPEMEDSFNRR